MPKRFITYSRAEPARTILWVVGLLTLTAQAAAMILSWPYGLANFAIVAPLSIWAIHSAHKNSVKGMSTSSFWLFLMWLWTGLSRLLFVDGVGELLWVPFLVVAAAMAVVYLYLSHQKRIGEFA